MPGLSFTGGDYSTGIRNYMKPSFSFKVNTMNAIGYNGRRLYGGLNYISDIYYVRIEKKLGAEIGQGKIKLFVGYRFGKK